jgi:hypothetical protein
MPPDCEFESKICPKTAFDSGVEPYLSTSIVIKDMCTLGMVAPKNMLAVITDITTLSEIRNKQASTLRVWRIMGT